METKVRKKAIKPPVKKTVKVQTIRKIGLADRTSEVGEIVEISIEVAKKLQDVGAIKVVL